MVLVRRVYQWLRKEWFPETQLERFDEAKKHVHADLAKFDERVRDYSALAAETRRTVRLILQIRVNRATPGKADLVRAAAVSAVTTVVVLVVAFSGQWISAWIDVSVIPWMAANPDKADVSEILADVTKWLFTPLLVAVLAIIAIPYVWGAVISGTDRRRTIYLAWLETYRESELELSRMRRNALRRLFERRR